MNTKTISEIEREKAVDRRIIRVDAPLPHAGISAALRRAFAACADGDHGDFDRLLARLS